jgi:hypothetical protein
MYFIKCTWLYKHFVNNCKPVLIWHHDTSPIAVPKDNFMKDLKQIIIHADFIHANQNNTVRLYRLFRLIFLGIKYHFLGTNFHSFEARNTCQRKVPNWKPVLIWGDDHPSRALNILSCITNISLQKTLEILKTQFCEWFEANCNTDFIHIALLIFAQSISIIKIVTSR